MDKLLFVPNPLLRQKAEKIKEVTDKEIFIVKKMKEIMLKAPGVGLAANQRGILKEIVTVSFVDQNTKNQIEYNLFNPNIISYSKEKVVMEEGCLSLPNQFAEIERSEKIKETLTRLHNLNYSNLKTSVEYEKSLKQELINILTENHSEILFAADSYKTSIEIYSSLLHKSNNPVLDTVLSVCSTSPVITILLFSPILVINIFI